MITLHNHELIGNQEIKTQKQEGKFSPPTRNEAVVPWNRKSVWYQWALTLIAQDLNLTFFYFSYTAIFVLATQYCFKKPKKFKGISLKRTSLINGILKSNTKYLKVAKCSIYVMSVSSFNFNSKTLKRHDALSPSFVLSFYILLILSHV